MTDDDELDYGSENTDGGEWTNWRNIWKLNLTMIKMVVRERKGSCMINSSNLGD